MRINRLISRILLCSALFVCTSFGFAQNQELAANVAADRQPVADADKSATIEKQPAATATKAGGDQKSKTEAILASAMETNKEIENPATQLWLLQTQFNSTMFGMPLNKGNYFQHTVVFEPLLPNELSKKWTIGFRPVLPIVTSNPYPQVTGFDPATGTLKSTMHRMTSFGDMTLGVGVNPNPELVHNWLLCAGASFIFPTATHDILGQKNWQAGPLIAVGKKGHHYISYVLQQTWWKVGGDGQNTRQSWVRYMYNYNWANGWMLGTQNDILIDWQAHRDQRVAFPIGPQVGKLVHMGPMPVQVALSASYYAFRWSNLHADLTHQTVVPKWNFQLQLTPIIPTLQEIIHHQIPQDPTRKH
jgi:hypothetical protein